MNRLGRRLGAAIVAVTALGLVLSSTTANASPVRNPVPDTIQLAAPELLRAAAATSASVPLTLVTGDQVQVGVDPDGRPVVQKVTAADRPGSGSLAFHTFTTETSVYVVPDDALSLLREDRLDWNLFNLVELGKHVANGTVGEVPVLVEHTTAAAAARAPQVTGATTTRTLSSIDASVATIAGDGQWWQAVQAAAGNGPAAAQAAGADPLAGVEKVWLNELVQVSLADSVPQIGAAVAWDLGFDGSGVTVAVLDTGIDQNHPDVAGKIVGQRDFINNDDDATDGHGHGTHVAATVAGTGAASNGLRPGVAPGADLLIGKVLSDGGSGTFDQIIAGMQWAAESGAPIVSMSLGGGPTDGTDPASMAVNQLSEQYGTLFVIAAGNAGPSPYTVATPGAADAALTVAAVDKSDQMASFSSRGPRVGDDAPKPDIAGPGVNIVAARAEGTTMGTPVDDLYTTASGTSMATPHVAGATALVAQQNPDLSGAELKGLMMGTSLDLGFDLYAQGAGRVDVARAIDPSVFSDGNVVFGRFEYPHQPVTDTITYTNVTDAPITLDLAGSMTASDGTPGPDGLITLSTEQVTVPANGTAGVDVTVDGSVLGDGDLFGPYGGLVNAIDANGDLRASSRVNVFLEPQRHDVTIQVTAPAGATGVSYGELAIVPMDDQVSLHDDPMIVPGGETTTARLFDGAYAVATSLRWQDADGVTQTGLATDPQVEVDGSTVTATLDLGDAQPALTAAPEPTETYQASAGYQRISAAGNWSVSSSLTSTYQDGDPSWWVTPTEPVTVGTLSFASQQVEVPSLLSIDAIGRGGSLTLHPRYATPDVSVPGGTQQWQDGEATVSRQVRLPMPRLAALRPSTLVHAGTGSAEELAEAEVDGALVLLTPTDICSAVCDFAALRERVANAAELGALGVLVAGQTGRVSLGAPPTPTVTCPDGPDSCPAVEPYAALPIASLPADEGAELVQRIEQGRVLGFVDADRTVSRAYTLGSATEGEVPADLAQRVRWSDLDRVEHRFHADRPGEVGSLDWRPFPQTESGSAAPTTALDLPLTETQASLAVYVSADDEVIHRFNGSTFAYAEPFIVDPDSSVFEEQDQLFDGDRDQVSWNLRPYTPAAALMPVTDSGYTIGGAFCAGCREGDALYPVLFRTTGGGARTHMLGMVNDTGAVGFILGEAVCEAPECETHLYDQDGNELEPRLVPVGFRIGAGIVPAGPAPVGQLSGTGFGDPGDGLADSQIRTDEETNR
ncbi:MAG: S8 family serine peptidase [Micromonosporaceae bacterium]|nr:S8 family serine peptidase [Micromonosporaceae bacterium]